MDDELSDEFVESIEFFRTYGERDSGFITGMSVGTFQKISCLFVPLLVFSGTLFELPIFGLILILLLMLLVSLLSLPLLFLVPFVATKAMALGLVLLLVLSGCLP